MADIVFYHGTQHAYDRIALPKAGEALGQGMDEYGTGFYTAVSSRPEDALAYAEGYADGAGLVLRGTIDSSQFAFLNFDAPLGDAHAKAMREALESLDTGNPKLNTYFREVSSKIVPDMNAKQLWDSLSAPSAFEAWQQSQLAPELTDREMDGVLRRQTSEMFETLLDSHDIDLSQTEALTTEQAGLVKEQLSKLAQENPQMAAHYRAISDAVIEGADGKKIRDDLRGGSKANAHLRIEREQSITRIEAFDMDLHATQALNNAGIDGLHVPSQDTLVFKGQSSVDKLPDMTVEKLVGLGPAPDKIHTASGKAPSAGEVMVRSPNSLQNLAASADGIAREAQQTAAEVAANIANGTAWRSIAARAGDNFLKAIPIAGIGLGVMSIGDNAQAGEYTEAALDAAGFIPVVGDALDIVRTAAELPALGAAAYNYAFGKEPTAAELANIKDTAFFQAVYDRLPEKVTPDMPPDMRALVEAKQAIAAIENQPVQPFVLGQHDALMNRQQQEAALEKAQQHFSNVFDSIQAKGGFGAQAQSAALPEPAATRSEAIPVSLSGLSSETLQAALNAGRQAVGGRSDAPEAAIEPEMQAARYAAAKGEAALQQRA